MASLIKPGALAVLLVGGVVLYGMFVWTTDSFERVENNSREQQRNALDCSSVSVGVAHEDVNSTHLSLFLEVNQPVEAVLVRFQTGRDNHTEILEDVSATGLNQVTAPVDEDAQVTARVRSCEGTFDLS
jgi:hypothetical protein